MEPILRIAGFIFDSFIHIWPYIFITIPLAVLVQLSDASKYIRKALNRNPLVSVFLATLVGAFSPFCSCGVIPVIASLLMGGVPLAPVMSFWIASPSMDPEIFFLSTAAIGWKLSIWRLAATFSISLLAGYVTHLALRNGMFGDEILRSNQAMPFKKTWSLPGAALRNKVSRMFTSIQKPKAVALQCLAADRSQIHTNINCCISGDELRIQRNPKPLQAQMPCGCNDNCKTIPVSFHRKLLSEAWKASVMVAKFMALAFFINAVIHFYVPQEFISQILGGRSAFSVITAAVIGIPVYSSNMTALPLISGLLTLGMNKGAALAFLISGPVTTLPAMVAVWGIVRTKIFMLYISIVMTGAIAFGLIYNLVN